MAYFKFRPPISSFGSVPLFSGIYLRKAMKEKRAVLEKKQQAMLQKIDQTTALLSIEDGATMIADRPVFNLLAHRDDVPGATGIREVKFVILKAQHKEPLLYFINSKKYSYHYSFVEHFLDLPLNLKEFTTQAYFTDKRTFLVGALLAHDNFIHKDGQKGLYCLEFWPSDPVSARLVIKAFRMIEAAMPFAKDKLFYHPSGVIQEEKAAEQKASFETAKIPVILNDKLFSSLRYSALNLGLGFGYLRIMDGANPQPLTATTIALFKTIPNNLPHVAGVISEEMQTPLSHINLLAKQNNTPNAYLQNASTDPRLLALKDKIVRLEVLPDGLKLRLATRTEMVTFLKDIRPKGKQFPQRDLSQTKILALEKLGYQDFNIVGAKAANLAELRHALGTRFVPSGFAVPFYFYDVFMRQNGLYAYILKKMAKKNFAEDAAKRKKILKKIRKKIKRAPMPQNLHHQLGVMRAQFPKGTTPRAALAPIMKTCPILTGQGFIALTRTAPMKGILTIPLSRYGRVYGIFVLLKSAYSIG